MVLVSSSTTTRLSSFRLLQNHFWTVTSGLCLGLTLCLWKQSQHLLRILRFVHHRVSEPILLTIDAISVQSAVGPVLYAYLSTAEDWDHYIDGHNHPSDGLKIEHVPRCLFLITVAYHACAWMHAAKRCAIEELRHLCYLAPS
ncbi:uncharacterized protein M421DRAFT_135076 [Didymella exigua CBS 183.55]|uniref:Uncharacterized protein n=1 Tax=Didymella exigua CBS 183.55 TaxID=1150837 RepID=A0A6A5RLE6_9PLEO|nr:uncharacterized protein M421DRAFT_135076 [Didymella exigua CBS 183.55]KAF1929251.1 hypothetical protein M421DRAFT_135076 [Didymella exigua CBS 183.55]